MAKQLIKSIRGVHDVLPNESPLWHYFERQWRQLMRQYGYAEIRMPILENTKLFSRSIGEVTDIVEKEMYTFTDIDRKKSSLTLRPEGTASCVRAGIQHGLFYNQQQRLWYAGPMFRRERPQKDRYRQFHQVGVEAFGFTGPDIDAELIFMTARFWTMLGLDNIRLELNSIGSQASRKAYKQVLVAYFSQYHDQLDDDSQRRLTTNPMRILDSKNPAMKTLIDNAPLILDHLDEESEKHFLGLRALLDQQGIKYTLNPRLVRGLDYYNKTVFEWVSDDLGAQGTVCGGGRYDSLVEQLGGHAANGYGFAMGVERLLSLIKGQVNLQLENSVDVYFVAVGDEAVLNKGLALAEKLRDTYPNLRLVVNAGAGSFKVQMKRADKSGATLALILGNSELETKTISIKPLRNKDKQQSVSWDELLIKITDHIERI